jgi:peptidoglycan/LPS O-acetylase OafA/YrhL
MNSDSSGNRLRFIDALRGIAALAVTLYHFTVHYPAIPAVAHGGLTVRDAFEFVAYHGNCGVDIFFVISGFVIAYSLRHLQPTPKNAGIFAVRRSLRLDPPYLVTLALSLGCAALSRLVLHDSSAYWPERWTDCLINMAYLQDFLGVRALLPVAWTLCIEIQFYLVFIVIWWVSSRARAGGLLLPAVFVLMAAWSLCVKFQVLAPPLPGLFIEHWYLFQLGVLVSWAFVGRMGVNWLLAYAAAVASFLLVRWDYRAFIGIVTALSVLAVGKGGHLADWLSWRPLQYLGRLSYSLYLVHTVVGSRVMNIMWRMTDHAPSFLTTLGFIALAVLASLLSAELLYRFVEKPSVDLAKRLKPPPRQVISSVAPLRAAA